MHKVWYMCPGTHVPYMIMMLHVQMVAVRVIHLSTDTDSNRTFASRL